jgi:hypothetical protein
MNLATFAIDRLAIVKREPRIYAIVKNKETLVRSANRWMVTGNLDDRYLTNQEAISFAACGKIVLMDPFNSWFGGEVK